MFAFAPMTRLLSVRNRQRVRAIATPLLRRITHRVLESELGVAAYELGIHLVEPEEMARVNQQFLQHEGSTDVITFDHTGLEANTSVLHGEIFISVADAVKQASQFRTTWQAEVVRYVIHGLLHLRGHDDLKPAACKVMKREENRLVKRIVSQFAIERLARTRSSKLATRTS
jgi:rRNA maturation RNase YbeY